MSPKEQNFQHYISSCSYPGRGLVMGVSEQGDCLIQVYWIMGRSENSRNRVFISEGPHLRTEAADPARLSDPSLVIYEAMLECGSSYIVSNGDQTRTVFQSLRAGGSFETALHARDREPDAPNFTPRITGCIDGDRSTPFYRFAILKANACDSSLSDRNFFYKESIEKGSGYLLTTYEGDDSPLPSFSGEPRPVPLTGSAQDILDQYWAALNEENKVALAVKTIDRSTGSSSILIQNKYSQV